jgi:hypothetical protein
MSIVFHTSDNIKHNKLAPLYRTFLPNDQTDFAAFFNPLATFFVPAVNTYQQDTDTYTVHAPL